VLIYWTSRRGRSASQTDQPAGPKVLPPFSGKLYVDFKQTLSKEEFKQRKYDFLKDKNITSPHPPNQLTGSPAFPKPHVLAQFPFKT